MKQYLNSCPKNTTYLSNATVESLLNAMNFYYESENLKKIFDAPFLCLYADEAKNSSHKECFAAMFLTYYSLRDCWVKTFSCYSKFEWKESNTNHEHFEAAL